jgi:hypothetical protein
MPFFKTTHNLLNAPWEDEFYDPNWANSNALILPPKKEWDYKREIQIEDVDVWELIYFASGGTMLAAAWDPYAEFYIVTKDLYLNTQTSYMETFYGNTAGLRAYKKAIEFGMPVELNQVWVEPEDMWLHA